MKGAGLDRDRRTWLLLLLALVPPASVLVGAVWLWSDRGEQIDQFAKSIVPVETSYQLFATSEPLLRSYASLRAAALPDATDEVLEQARQDQAEAIEAIDLARLQLVPLVDALDPETDVRRDQEVLELIGQAIGLASDAVERQVPGEPVTADLQLIIRLTRDNAGGLVLPFIGSDSDVGFFYDAISATLRYYAEYDNDRGEILALLERAAADPDTVDFETIESELRSIATSPLAAVRMERSCR